MPILIALVNSLSPLFSALESCIVLTFLTLFLLGAFPGVVSGRFWLWSGLRTLMIAFLTAGIIWLI